VRALLKHPWVMPWYWVALSMLLIAADHLTHPYIQFPILFLIPVVLAAVYNGPWWGLGLAIVMPLVRCYFEIQMLLWAVTEAF
jgi:predicted membrane protein